MTPQIISLNPKLTPPRPPPEQPKSNTPTPKLLSKTAFPKKAPEGARPAKLEPGDGELGENNRTSRPSPQVNPTRAHPSVQSLRNFPDPSTENSQHIG
ncbi:hypothetical protein [Acaryochloris sp. 'Moss Beach']|uniref:hypothetical protein n=1 Tax=Acaryochloris sp. 'Moss Beach' TaxID=2740837 RepID=UPI0028F418F9|nr:hypothetical protein [Acaryochloris sp. 'Moss Beach']